MIEFVVLVFSAYVAWSLISLELHYRRASSMRIPLVRVPIDPLNLFFMVIEPHVFKLIDLLPPSILPNFVRYMRRGWFFLDKADSHLKHGPIWACVTPRGIHIQVCDSEAIHDMFNRRYDFIRPSENYTSEVYGPCISTADLDNWPRHRKILAAPFNESVMKLVWNESLDQTKQMIECWTDPVSATESFARDTRTLSLNVLAATGFRRSFRFRPAVDGSGEPDVAASYRNALSTVLDNVIILMLLPYRHLTLPFFPKSLQAIGKAGSEFKHHMERMLAEETAALERGDTGAGSLMTSFVKAMNVSGPGAKESKSKGLSVDEIYGNIFVINFAGHDTTANTLAFSMALLATEPELQDWIAEEVRKATLVDEEWDYTHVYPQLPRCRAILYETLRLLPPIMALPKHTSSEPQHLKVGDRIILIPANTSTSPSLLAVHTHPMYWPDPLKWKPSRWINIKDGQEAIITPVRDTYFPWSDGPQNCPGRKFSEVEFVAVLALLMRDHKLEIVKEDGETEREAKDRALNVINDCDMQMLSRMRNPDRLKLRCEKRIEASRSQ